MGKLKHKKASNLSKDLPIIIGELELTQSFWNKGIHN